METVWNFIKEFSFGETFSAFVVLFAVIDIIGSIPIIIDINQRQGRCQPMKAAGYSFLVFMGFLFLGDGLLNLFNVDFSSFAVAGSIVLLVLAIEMTFGYAIFKNDGPKDSAFVVPLVFPLIAGAASLTTMLSLRAEYHLMNIIVAVFLNMVVVYVVIRNVDLVERILGKGGIYILRKFFGIILLAMSVRLFASNISSLIN